MKKTKVFVCIFVVLVIMFSFAFAESNINDDQVLRNIIIHTDAQFAPVFNKLLDQDNVFMFSAPAIIPERSTAVSLVDITKVCTSGDEVISAYPKVYTLFNSEENSRIIRVFRFTHRDGSERRIEVYYTGGDWMQYGLTYIVTNAGVDKNLVSAYFVKELSTPDREEGSLPPWIDPFDQDPNSPKKLVEFIASDFLGANGNVREEVFINVASTSVK